MTKKRQLVVSEYEYIYRSVDGNSTTIEEILTLFNDANIPASECGSIRIEAHEGSYENDIGLSFQYSRKLSPEEYADKLKKAEEEYDLKEQKKLESEKKRKATEAKKQAELKEKEKKVKQILGNLSGEDRKLLADMLNPDDSDGDWI